MTSVLRAMSFGALSSSSNDDRGRDSDQPSSRSSSKNRFSKTLSRESTLELDESLGLERSLSRLSLVSSASGARAPGGGILINRSRPSSPQPPTSRSLSYEAEPVSTSIGSSSGSLTDRTGRPLPPIRTHSSTSSATNGDEPLTPSSPGFIVNPQSFPPTTMGLVREESIERKKPKIKFAPLPQIRPRSYSTGRNVWAEHDPEDEDGFGGEFVLEDAGGPLGGRHLVRREDGKIIPFDDDENPLFDEDEYDEDDDGRSGGGSKFNPRRQSWTDSLGMGSVWGSSSNNNNGHKRDKSREIDEDAVSLGSSAGGGNNSDYGLSSSGGKEKESGGVSKILKPFLFGRKKSIKSNNKVSSTDDNASAGVGLSRQSSGESQISSKSSIDNNATPGPPTPTNEGVSRSKGSTGIPMRKASTWDSTNSAGSKGSNSTTTKKTSNRNSASLPRDPSTPQIIYYASPSRSSRPTRRAQYPPVAQRSRTAPKTIRQSKVEEPEFSEWGSVGSVGSVGSRVAKSAGDDDEDGSGMAWIRKRRKEREEKEKKERDLALAQAAATASTEPDSEPPVEIEEPETRSEEDKENEVAQRAIGRNPKRQSTVDSTFSMTSSTSTIRPSSPKIMSGLSLSRPVETQEPVELGQDSPELASDEEEDEEEEEEEDVEADASDDDDEEEEEEEVEEQEEDDLDAEELAKEEALCDAARRTANCAGAERYHSTTHENVLHVPSDTIKRQPSQNLKRSNSNGSQVA
ncbi:hypothetical protein JCM3765_001709 [Sporobolomyces pararoseus]